MIILFTVHMYKYQKCRCIVEILPYMVIFKSDTAALTYTCNIRVSKWGGDVGQAITVVGYTTMLSNSVVSMASRTQSDGRLNYYACVTIHTCIYMYGT